jgi:hypothetical protein
MCSLFFSHVIYFFMSQPRQTLALLSFFVSSLLFFVVLFNDPLCTQCYWHCVPLTYRYNTGSVHLRTHITNVTGIFHHCLFLSSRSVWHYYFFRVTIDKSCVPDYLSCPAYDGLVGVLLFSLVFFVLFNSAVCTLPVFLHTPSPQCVCGCPSILAQQRPNTFRFPSR